MGQITVRAETNTLGMSAGDEQTVEDTPFLRKVIDGGRLSLVHPTTDADTAASQPAPPPAPEAPLDRPPAKRRGRAEQPADVDLDGPAGGDVVEARPAADVDDVPGAPLVTLRPTSPEAA